MSEGQCLICRDAAVPEFRVSFRGEERLPFQMIRKGRKAKLRRPRAPLRFAMHGTLCQPCCNNVYKAFKRAFGLVPFLREQIDDE